MPTKEDVPVPFGREAGLPSESAQSCTTNTPGNVFEVIFEARVPPNRTLVFGQTVSM